MLPSFCNDSIKVVRAPLVSSRGSVERDWSRATETTLNGCSVQPTATSANLEGREQTAIAFDCYAPQDSDIQASDRIEFNGESYAIDGVPFEWKSPTGAVSHMLIKLKRWQG